MLRITRKTPAFTSIELFMVLAALALLLFICLPSLHAARRQDGLAQCLNNLSRIGMATQMYASEDPHELIVPIHQMMRQQTGSLWLWRQANWHAWGGSSATKRFFTVAGCTDENAPACGPLLSELSENSRDQKYAGATRPLNSYMADLESFHCPMDNGYPDDPSIDDAPRANANRLLYETLGNSYRASLYCFINDTGAFAIGPWGHRLSTLCRTDRLILMNDPMFFAQIGQEDLPNGIHAGWHGVEMSDNVLYCDGSARLTSAKGYSMGDWNDQRKIGSNWFLSRGPTWTIDAYPTPGARIWGAGSQWNPPYNFLGNPNYWPFKDTQRNLD